jgi:hypothetical protein
MDIKIYNENCLMSENITRKEFKQLINSNKKLGCAFVITVRTIGLVTIIATVKVQFVLWLLKIKKLYIKSYFQTR